MRRIGQRTKKPSRHVLQSSLCRSLLIFPPEQHGGLIFYFYSSPVASLPLAERNAGLATCIWSSRADAVKALRGPKHAEAVRLAQRAYESFTLERYILRKDAGGRTVRVEEWHGGEVAGLEEEE
jgi:hypothetical protein